jgi:hypothetical protein
LAFDAIGNAFELFRHVPHVFVIATGDDARSLHIAAVDHPGSQDEGRGFQASAEANRFAGQLFDAGDLDELGLFNPGVGVSPCLPQLISQRARARPSSRMEAFTSTS